MQDLCDEHVLPMDSDDDVEDAEQRQAGQSSAAAASPPPPPPYANVAEHFCELEDIAEKCDMSEASYHLRKAKLAWMSAHGLRATKQTCMRAFL